MPVVVELFGGLGNQMFQYAAGRALAVRLNAELLLDPGYYEKHNLRVFELGNYRLPAKIAAERDIKLAQGRKSALGKLLPSWWTIESGKVFREEGLFRYDPRFENLGEHVYLSGYWQTDRYFRSIRSILLEDFVLKVDPGPENSRLLREIEAGLSVSLHVRRGDYVTDPSASAVHGTCDPGYYEAAVSSCLEKLGSFRLFVFSDDPEWAEKNLSFPVPTTIVNINPPSKGVYDMKLMTACRHHIIANSSFSWWAAWLSNAPDKIVLCPKQWFRDPAKTTPDLLPREWYVVE